MQKSKNKVVGKKNSKSAANTLEEKVLLKKFRTEGLRVNLHFVTQRIQLGTFEDENGEEVTDPIYEKVAVQSFPVSKEMMTGRTIYELKVLLKEIANDKGAKFFTLS